MKILVLAPMREECTNFSRALAKYQLLGRPLRHTYKVVECGVGKANAAATTALELSNSYDLIAVVGYAAASPLYPQGSLVIPSLACYHDTQVPDGLVPELTQTYPLEGSDSCTILTGDQFVDKSLADALTSSFSSRVLFDMESSAVCQIASDYSVPVLVLKLVSDVPQSGDNAQSFSEFVATHTDFSDFVKYLELLSAE